MSVSNSRVLKIAIFIIVFATTSFCKLFAQSRIDVKKIGNRTSVLVSNFPKHSTVLIVDDNFNLLSTTSTNEEGSAIVLIKKKVKNTIIARTVHGDFEASNKAVQPPNKPERNMAVSVPNKPIKA